MQGRGKVQGVGGSRLGEESQTFLGGQMPTTAMLRGMLPPPLVLRDPMPSTWDSGEAPFGIPEALLIIGIVVLLLLLAGTVVWRVRRSPRNRSK